MYEIVCNFVFFICLSFIFCAWVWGGVGTLIAGGGREVFVSLAVVTVVVIGGGVFLRWNAFLDRVLYA